MTQPNSQHKDGKPRPVVVACTLESFKQLLQNPSPTTIASSVEDRVLAASPSPSTAPSSPTKSRSSRSMEIAPRVMGIDSTSPSKKSSNKGLSTINRRWEMGQMTPPVEFMTPEEWKVIGPVSDNVRNFWVNHIRCGGEGARHTMGS
ncbi:hypothetical protein JMJ35_010660 [Cladonia borealis]|uniref:Uncharacterized protein n=1 Tax=Cladonia borealis TaxID=184061 RepID=A0AA39QRY8_9LECA|nr:hypothetical protein JMJ35_010660 [Cladonia borealis]